MLVHLFIGLRFAVKIRHFDRPWLTAYFFFSQNTENDIASGPIYRAA